jgi:hypothetical protein
MTTTIEIVAPTLCALRNRFDDIDSYFDQICTMDQARTTSEMYAKWIPTHPNLTISYDPSKPLNKQDCDAYFNLIESLGVTPFAREYLTTRSWFMHGTVSASLLMAVALSGRGEYVYATVGNFPEDLCYILTAQ